MVPDESTGDDTTGDGTSEEEGGGKGFIPGFETALLIGAIGISAVLIRLFVISLLIPGRIYHIMISQGIFMFTTIIITHRARKLQPFRLQMNCPIFLKE